MIPGVGAIINGGLDLTETKIIADRAYKMFFNGIAQIDDDVEVELEISK